MGVNRRGQGCVMGLRKGLLRGEGWGEGESVGGAAGFRWADRGM